MRLIGMLDSPFVRRVAVTLDVLDVPFTHEAVSVFSTFEKFQRINPVVKAPTLVLDDGTVLMDSSLILAYVESTLPAAQSLWSKDGAARALEYRVVSLSVAGCEKCAQYIYERNLRPQQFQFEPWLTRVAGQLREAFAAVERELTTHALLFSHDRSHAAIAAGIAWSFSQSMLAQLLPAAAHPALSRLSGRMERTSTFIKYPPDGPGVPSGSV
ncbi:MAG TPA: glutathione S-transferase family protein [Steroidobacteraceae bacterium]|nr:glutathione S-transferase family protein [Steroidobacteraceae bacterium]